MNVIVTKSMSDSGRVLVATSADSAESCSVALAQERPSSSALTKISCFDSSYKIIVQSS